MAKKRDGWLGRGSAKCKLANSQIWGRSANLRNFYIRKSAELQFAELTVFADTKHQD